MSLVFHKLHPYFVAEVSAVDLRRVQDRETLDEIRGGMDEYAVLVFRDQSFSDEEQLAFAQPIEGARNHRVTEMGLRQGDQFAPGPGGVQPFQIC